MCITFLQVVMQIFFYFPSSFLLHFSPCLTRSTSLTFPIHFLPTPSCRRATIQKREREKNKKGKCYENGKDRMTIYIATDDASLNLPWMRDQKKNIHHFPEEYFPFNQSLSLLSSSLSSQFISLFPSLLSYFHPPFPSFFHSRYA